MRAKLTMSKSVLRAEALRERSTEPAAPHVGSSEGCEIGLLAQGPREFLYARHVNLVLLVGMIRRDSVAVESECGGLGTTVLDSGRRGFDLPRPDGRR